MGLLFKLHSEFMNYSTILALHTDHIPSEWKSANVTPVHKNDLKEQAENYRPISLLPIGPILGKVLERCRYASDFTIMLDISLQNFNTDFSDNVHVPHSCYLFCTSSDNLSTRTSKLTLALFRFCKGI